MTSILEEAQFEVVVNDLVSQHIVKYSTFFEQYKGLQRQQGHTNFISLEASHTQIGVKLDFGLLNNK